MTSAIGIAAALLLAAAPAGAAQTEQVSDGGFEANSCADNQKGNCTNPNWVKDTASPQRQNYFCKSTTCEGSPASGSGWLQLGGSNLSITGTSTGFVTQDVTIPAAPATVAYSLEYTPGVSTTDMLTVSMDGNELSVTPGASAPTTYTVQTTDASNFATPGTHVLEFATLCQGLNPAICGTFDIDSVSLLSGTPVNEACEKAKDKLKKAKAKLRKLKRDDASKKAIKRAKAKVKAAERAVEDACAT